MHISGCWLQLGQDKREITKGTEFQINNYMRIHFLLTLLIIAILTWSCEKGKRTISDSEIPKYILKPANISSNNLQITWRIMILDSVVTKKQLLALATKMKDEDTQEREIVTIHFYPN